MSAILLVAVIAAQTLDVATWLLMPRYAEANFLVAGMHTETAVLAKGALLVLVLALQPILRPKYRPVGELVAILALAAGCVGAGSNLSVIAGTGKDVDLGSSQVRSFSGGRSEDGRPNGGLPSLSPNDHPSMDVHRVAGRARYEMATLAALHGRASWFRAAPGVAAAGPALRKALGRYWRGSRVSVCAAGGRCVSVIVSDWCQCYRGTPGERLLDLSASAFRELSPLAVGIVRVRVDVPRLAPPQTDAP